MLPLLAACSDSGVKHYNSPPTAVITAPESETAFAYGQAIELTGLAADEQTPLRDLLVSWVSDRDGELDTNPPDSDGVLYFATASLTEGPHAITLNVTDEDGEAVNDTIAIQVGEGTGKEPGAPTVVITGPADGSQHGASAGVNLVATVADDLDLCESLRVEVTDSVGGVLHTGNPTAACVVTFPMVPKVGPHTVTLSAVDSEGKVGTASVGFEVVEDDRPVVNIVEPADGASFLTTETITFRGTISDDVTPTELLTLDWSSDLSGTFSTSPADSAGNTAVSLSLAGGTHTITLAAFDADAHDGRDSIVVTVTDPNDIDDDHDGYTENQGDCDDDDALKNPGQTDICDDADNDCSGYINDPWFDTYEVNNTLATAYNAGEVDEAFGWANSTLELSGLTLSDSTDEDWIAWDADDAWYDNVTVSVVVSGLSSKGTYVVELIDRDDGSVKDSDSGAGNSGLKLDYEGDVSDTDEDHWAVRVRATKWPSNSCDSQYSLTIKS